MKRILFGLLIFAVLISTSAFSTMPRTVFVRMPGTCTAHVAREVACIVVRVNPRALTSRDVYVDTPNQTLHLVIDYHVAWSGGQVWMAHDVGHVRLVFRIARLANGSWEFMSLPLQTTQFGYSLVKSGNQYDMEQVRCG